MRLWIAYALFAALSIFLNILVQNISVSLYRGERYIEISILIGTLSGLALKYFLDKRYIFRFRADGISHEGRTFALYTFMGIFTTALFWSTEFAFQTIFQVDQMRYLGGAIGLIAGYLVKYNLDKKYVFMAAE